MGLIKTADIKTKYSRHFDFILPQFPIYLKKICRDRNFDDIYILKYVNPNNHDQKDIDKININLNNRKLICTYIKTSKHLKYRGPLDVPYVVTELTRQVIFDVDNNSVYDFNESENTYEISSDKVLNIKSVIYFLGN